MEKKKSTRKSKVKIYTDSLFNYYKKIKCIGYL